jgi:HK97 family phage prohead protease
MKDLYLYKDFTSSPSIKDVDGKKGVITGYFADFNSIDSDGDIIKPGAFAKSISETGPSSRKPRIKHLMNHDITQPLGVLQTLSEDSKGLRYESQLGTHALGVDFIKMADSGLITEHSIGYRMIKYSQVKPWADWKEGEAARELTELKLWEGSSLTAWGANANTPLIGIKGLTKEQAIEMYIRKSEAIDKFCRATDATDETIEMLLLHNKQLTQLIIDTQPASAVEPTSNVFADAVDSFIHSSLKPLQWN